MNAARFDAFLAFSHSIEDKQYSLGWLEDFDALFREDDDPVDWWKR